MSNGRIHICYFYNGEASSDSTRVSSEGEVPKRGTTVQRLGKPWHVSDVERKTFEGAPQPFFIVHLYSVHDGWRELESGTN